MAKFNLANTPTSVTSKFKIILNDGRLDACASKEDVIDLCKSIFAEAGLDTPWTRTFLAKLSFTRSPKDAKYYVTNAYLSGTGNAVIK